MLYSFDYRDVACKNHKFGLIYQAVGQTTEKELFNNYEHSDDMEKFMEMLGTKVDMASHKKYSGGLGHFEVVSDELAESSQKNVERVKGGTHSLYTEHEGKGVMFHVSTLLHHTVDGWDEQQIQVRHRYINFR